MGIVNLDFDSNDKFQTEQHKMNQSNQSIADSELEKYFQSTIQDMSLKIFGKDIHNH